MRYLSDFNSFLNESLITDIFEKLRVKFKAFLQNLEEESEETKEAFKLLINSVRENKKLTPKEREEIGNQMKDVLKTLGFVAAATLPGGAIYFIIVKLLKLEKYTLPSSFLTK
jgi:hypothetical protein